MNIWVETLSGIFLLAGGFFCMVGGVGLVRMPDLYTRMHAASVTETLGVGFVLFGLILIAGWTLVTVKLLMIGLLIGFVSPVSCHALARAAILRKVKPLLAKSESEPSKP